MLYINKKKYKIKFDRFRIQSDRPRIKVELGLTRAYLLYEKSKRPIFGPKTCNESSFAGHIMQTIINICLRKNKSKQSCVWID